MTQSKELQNEKLINDLYEKLHWYTFEASDEQFDAEEVDAIVQLLDVLEPMKEDPRFPSDPAAARERFNRRFGVEEDGAGEVDIVSEAGADGVKAGRKRGWKRKKFLIRLGVGVAACIVLMLSVNVGSYALKQKSFFEVVQDGIGRTKVTITGNVNNIDDEKLHTVTYDSWDEVEKAVGYKFIRPTYIPEGYSLELFTVGSLEYEKKVVANYTSEEGIIRIKIDIYAERYNNTIIQYDNEWKLVKEEKNEKYVQYYAKGNKIEAFFTSGKAVYFIYSTLELEEMENIVSKMK